MLELTLVTVVLGRFQRYNICCRCYKVMPTEAGSVSFDYYTANWQGFTYPVWISSKPHAYLASSTNVAGIVFNSGSPGSANKGARVAYEVVS